MAVPNSEASVANRTTANRCDSVFESMRPGDEETAWLPNGEVSAQKHGGQNGLTLSTRRHPSYAAASH